jgi:hypothetical protein
VLRLRVRMVGRQNRLVVKDQDSGTMHEDWPVRLARQNCIGR